MSLRLIFAAALAVPFVAYAECDATIVEGRDKTIRDVQAKLDCFSKEVTRLKSEVDELRNSTKAHAAPHIVIEETFTFIPNSGSKCSHGATVEILRRGGKIVKTVGDELDAEIGNIAVKFICPDTPTGKRQTWPIVIVTGADISRVEDLGPTLRNAVIAAIE